MPLASNKVRFSLTGPGKIIGVGNGDPSCHEADKPASPDSAERSAFNGLGMVLVQAGGGGTLFFPAGAYLCFTIRLKSNVGLYLSQGVIILAADSPKPGEATGYNGGVYDPAGPEQPWEKYQDYGHNHWPNSLFCGENISDFSIVGPGLIHGKGLSFGQGATRGDYAGFKAEQPWVGNKAISLKNCRNVLLRDFSILKGGALRDSRHRRRQHDHRQPGDRHRSRRHGYRLLP